MTRKERRTLKMVAVILLVLAAFVAMFLGYKAVSKRQAPKASAQKTVETVEMTVTAKEVVNKKETTPKPSTVVANQVTAPVAPVATTTPGTVELTIEEIRENTTVEAYGEEVDNDIYNKAVPGDYKTAAEKEEELRQEKEAIEAEKNADISSENDEEIVVVPETKEEVENIVDPSTGEAMDDTDVAVKDAEAADTTTYCSHDDDNHQHVVYVAAGYTTHYCEKVTYPAADGKVQWQPWSWGWFNTEAEYYASLESEPEAEVVAEEEIVEVEENENPIEAISEEVEGVEEIEEVKEIEEVVETTETLSDNSL